MTNTYSDPTRQPTVLPQRGITCIALKRIGKGALVGVCDIKIEAWHLVLKDCTWFAKDGREWIGLPTNKLTLSTGKDYYKQLVEFDDRQAADRFQAAALEAVKAFE